MLRPYVFTTLALVLLVGAAPAEKKASPLSQRNAGKIKKIDVKKGLLILIVKEDGKEKAVRIKIDDDTRFIAFTKVGRKELTAEEAADSEAFKAGTSVQVAKGSEGQARFVSAGAFQLPVPVFSGPGTLVTGTIKEVVPDKGTVTVTVKGKGKDKDEDFKVGKDTKVIVFAGQRPPKMSQGKAGLKSDQVKTGATVHLKVNEEGQVHMIVVGNPSGPIPDQPLGTGFTSGLVKKIDADKGVLTVTTLLKGRPRDVDYKIGKQTTFTFMSPKGKPNMATGTKGLKRLKKGTQVGMRMDPEGRVSMVMAMSKPVTEDDEDEPDKPVKVKVTKGTINEVDAENGTLVLTVKEDGESKEVKITVTAKTKFISGAKDDKKEVTGKKALKANQFKKGKEVIVVENADGSAKTVTAKPPKGKLEREN